MARTITTDICINSTGVPVTGLSISLKLRRISDGYWWSGSAWQVGLTSVTMTQVDATNMAGIYHYTTVPEDTVLEAYLDAGATVLNRYQFGLFEIGPSQALTNYDPPTRAEATTDKTEVISEVNDNEAKIDLIQTDIKRVLGLLWENIYIDQQIFDHDDNLLTGRIRLYDSKANATAHGATGLIGTYSVTFTYSGGLMQSQLTVIEP